MTIYLCEIQKLACQNLRVTGIRQNAAALPSLELTCDGGC
jgi:hypothetical protein